MEWIQIGAGFIGGMLSLGAGIALFRYRLRFPTLTKTGDSCDRFLDDRALPDQESLLRLVMDALPVAVFYIDQELSFRFCNSTYATWRKVTRDEIVGRSLRDVIGELSYKNTLPHIERVFANRQSHHYEMAIEFPSGERHVSVTGVPDIDDAGEVKGIIAIVNDVTQQMNATNELRLARDAADAANRAKSAFLANMSHEIRTPLGAVLGFSELLGGQRLSRDERRNYLGAIRRNGELLLSIINDILDLSKVEAEKLEIDRQRVALSEILSDVVAILNPKAREKSLRLSVSCTDAVPDMIYTDSLRLRQVLLNVVGNAVKFTDEGSVDILVSRIKTAHRDHLVFDVKDTGPGIDPEQASHLFRPFSQIDRRTNRLHGGTGLGLVLSKRMANLLGGDVVLASSRLGEGSTFSIAIDPGPSESRQQVHRDFLPDIAPEQRVPRLDGLKVLYAEDSVDNRLLVTRLLKIAGAEVETAENGKEALEKAARDNYSVLLMDLQMPVMDGFEAVAALRKRGDRRPVIALTAFAMNEQRVRCLSRGFNDHLAKPIDRKKLVTSIAYHAQSVISSKV